MEKTFPMVAKTFQGLEDVLRDELIGLGAQNVELGNRMVSFEGDLEMMYKANMCCRTALRILKPIVRFIANDPDELYDAVRDLDWSEFMGPDSTFAIDSTVNSAEFTHSRFVTYRVKDGIVDHFNDKLGRRPSIRVSGADVLLNVHISDNRVTISLDSSGEPLSKRGYRVEQTEAPINEVLAAGIIMKTGWRGESDFVDPMCGSGTFLIEAALIAANINPGVYREHFAFEKWPDFDKELFEEIYNDDSEEREFAYKIYGGDIDPEAVTIARKNIRNARVDDMVELVCRPFADWTDNAAEGILVTNPPYGERLRPDDMTGLFKGIGSTLKNYFKGWHAWILGYRDEHFTDIGLKPTVKIPMLNGSLECSLREYVLFDGSYSAFRGEGGSIGNREKDNGPRKVRHISDDEWEKESKAFNKTHGKGIVPKRDQRKDGKRPDKRSGYSDKRALPTSGPKGRYDDFDDFEQDITPRTSAPARDRETPRRDGERPSYQRRDGERNSYPRRDGERPSYPKRDGERGGAPRRDGERPSYPRRDGERGAPRRDGERPSYPRRDGENSASRPAREIKPRGPRLPETSATVFSKVPMRSRKPAWKKTGGKDNGADE